MNIKITCRKFKAKDSLKDFIKEEISHLNRFSDDILDVNVILSFTHPKESIKTVEIILAIPGNILNVSEKSEDFMKSVSLAIGKLERQLKKVKTKKLAKVR
jgi:putative sigma-54 modulation protein